jgi:hypothetical protein
LFQGKGRNGCLGGLFDAVLGIWLPAVGIDQGIDAALSYRGLIAIEGIAGEAHHLAGAGYVAKLGSQPSRPCV